MKKSEYMAARLRVHEKEPWIVSETARVQKDVEAAEAAGVVWDPEEEPLPERLRVEMVGCEVYAVRAKEGRCLTRREAEEIKRRYDAWPELLQLLQEMRGGMWGEVRRRLQEILRGGAS